LQRVRQNALIRRDVTVPKGSGGRESGRPDWRWKRQRATNDEVTDAGRNPEVGDGVEGRTGRGSSQLEAKR
jgi:hypothetical protein